VSGTFNELAKGSDIKIKSSVVVHV
jgi:hypothetical protein